jgi:hypothetical protein
MTSLECIWDVVVVVVVVVSFGQKGWVDATTCLRLIAGSPSALCCFMSAIEFLSRSCRSLEQMVVCGVSALQCTRAYGIGLASHPLDMLLGQARHLHGGAVLSRLGCFQSGREVVSTAVNHEVSRRTGSSTGSSSTGPGSASSTRLGWVAWAHSTAPVQSAALRVATIVQTRMDERVVSGVL